MSLPEKETSNWCLRFAPQMKNTPSHGCLETRPQLRSFQTWTAQSAKSVLGKTVRHIAIATVGLTLGVSHLIAAGISPIPDSQVNGSAQIVNGAIQLTNGSGNETGSAFYKTRISTKKFSTHFTVQLSNALADGFTFCLQNDSPTALGSPGQGSNLGFAEIQHSIAIAFNIYAGGTLIPQTSFAADGSISPFWESSFLR